jgi:hypothetical protein
MGLFSKWRKYSKSFIGLALGEGIKRWEELQLRPCVLINSCRYNHVAINLNYLLILITKITAIIHSLTVMKNKRSLIVNRD